jgi:hypothetical protein
MYNLSKAQCKAIDTVVKKYRKIDDRVSALINTELFTSYSVDEIVDLCSTIDDVEYC